MSVTVTDKSAAADLLVRALYHEGYEGWRRDEGSILNCRIIIIIFPLQKRLLWHIYSAAVKGDL